MKKNIQKSTLQFSLFDNEYRAMADKDLINELTNKTDVVSDIWENGYRLEQLFNRLTPQRRRIAAAAVELYKRREMRGKAATVVRSSKDIYNIMRPLVADLPNEEFWIIALSQSAKIIAKKRISVGGINQTSADVRLIMRILIEVGATQYAAVHNHPSGNSRPSNDDRRLTGSLKNAAELFNIQLIDHVVIAGDTYYSFNDEGLL